MYSSVLKDTGPAQVYMSSLPTALGPVIVESMNGNPIEVLQNSAVGGDRICIVGPYESVVLVGTTRLDGKSTLLMSTQGEADSSGAGEPQCYGYRVSEHSIGDISSLFTDEAADTEIILSTMGVNTTYSSLSCALEGLSTAAAAHFAYAGLSSNIAQTTLILAPQFNDAASSAMGHINLFGDALADVGIVTSS
jgi:hypothetical protein